MRLFPAIDLKDGACVRLIQGEMSQATIFNTDPADQAQKFEAQGFDYLHLVDLNGAFEGKPVNAEAVAEILQNISIPVQLGGGIRDIDTIEMWLDKGVSRVILGTIAERNPAFVKEACKKFPGKIVVGIDAREVYVAIEGWAESSELRVYDMADRFEDAGVAAIVYTDIERDGILTGLNLSATLKLAEHTSIPVIASGGLSSIEDIKEIVQPKYAILEGAISGRALYDGRLDPQEAITLIKDGAPDA
jgi:phosphoribosylformimino-5-aminoimidazole carboxamide ribotide isomerase